MAIPWQLVATAPGNYGPSCNFPIKDAWWQDAAAEGDTLQFQDAIGTLFEMTCTAIGYPTPIGELGWFHGPITITQISSGKVYFIISRK